MFASTLSILTRRYIGSFIGLPTVAWKGILISLIESALIAICYYLAIYFVKELHYSVLQASTLVTCYGIGSMVGALLAGKLSDKVSPKIISGLALFLQAATYLLLIINKNFYCLIINLFVTGIASYGFITASHAWILAQCNSGEKQRLKAINILSVASNLGLGLSALLISFTGFINFTAIFLFSSLILIFMGLYFLNLKDDAVKKVKSSKEILNTKTTNNSSAQYIIFYALTCLFFMGILISQFNSTYPLFLIDTFQNMGIRSFSILFIINTFMVVFLQTILVEIFSKNNKILLLGISTLISGLGMLVLNFLLNFNVAILSIVFLSIGEILFFSIAQLICYEKSPPHQKGHSLGLYRMVFASSRIVGPIIGGFIYQKFGGQVLWYFCFFLGSFCLLPALLLKRKR